MSRLALVVFPEMDTTTIEAFRAEWDPLAAVVAAHITIAFPFEWPGTTADLAGRLAPVAAAQPAFGFRLTGMTVSDDDYLFLLFDAAGAEQVRRLHEAVHRLAVPGMSLVKPFVPHLTVGRLAGRPRPAGPALPLGGTAAALSVYRLGAGGGRAREHDLPLG